MKKYVCLAFLSLSVFFCFKGYAQAFDVVIKIDTIKGESKVAGHEGEIDIYSYSEGFSSCIPNSTSKITCKAVASTFNFLTPFDKSTIPLMMASVTARTLPFADISFIRPSGDSRFEFYRVHLESVTVVSVQESGSRGGDAKPTISISLSFARIAWQYTIQSSTGAADEKVTGGWDFVLSKPFSYTF